MPTISVAQVIAELWKILQENMSAIALLIFNYEEYKVMRANREKADALLALQLEENKNAIDQKYAGKSDDDIIAGAISSGPASNDGGSEGSGDSKN